LCWVCPRKQQQGERGRGQSQFLHRAPSLKT
jgi:hypothetical protein